MQIQGYAGTGNLMNTVFGMSGLTGAKKGGGLLGQLKTSTDWRAADLTFGQDIARRAASLSTPAVSTDKADNAAKTSAASVRDDKLSDLAKSLGRAVDFVRENYGDQAAQATMGLVYKSVGNQAATEDAIGQGLTKALQFMDANFGTAAGDKVMSFFNQDVNQTLNSVFNNGKNEIFYAATQGKGQQGTALLSSLVGQVSDVFGQDAGQDVLAILTKSLKENGAGYAGLRKGLAATAAYLHDRFGAQAGAPETIDATGAAAATRAATTQDAAAAQDATATQGATAATPADLAPTTATPDLTAPDAANNETASVAASPQNPVDAFLAPFLDALGASPAGDQSKTGVSLDTRV